MSINLNPYLSFRGEARQAMEFYESVFGGTLTSSTFAEFGMSSDPAEADLVMHAQLVTPAGLILMGSDVPSSMPYTVGDNISVSLSGDEDDEVLSGWFAALAEGGEITLPLEKAPWGDSFGQLTDRFGIHWLVNIGGTAA
ncbi:VOC family protein [Herbiconiux solani]|uniref:VOC family protein n=1 Tax=Herbiconiux solani TaxID=661329 RepID=UPI000825F1C0|nr:VOC family protein [Herbiconiux solani]